MPPLNDNFNQYVRRDCNYILRDGDLISVPIVPTGENTMPVKKLRKYTCNGCGQRNESHHGIAGKNYCDACCFICSGCYKAHLNADCHKVGEKSYCAACYNVRYRTCEGCGEVISIYDAHCDPDGNDYCTSCFHDRYTVCNGCGNLIEKSDAIESEGGTDYCRSCYESRFMHCEDCGEELRRRDAHSDDDGDTYCEDCWVRNHAVCAECEEHVDGATLVEHYHRYYCPTCFAEHFAQCGRCGSMLNREELISQAGLLVCPICKRKYAEWKPVDISDCDDGWKYGIELETSECNDSDDLYNNTVFGCHSDGSILGMEYISPIMSGKRGYAEIDKLCKYAKEHNWRVNDDHTNNRACGYHIHLNMRGLRMTDLHRIITAYYLTENLWRAFVGEDRAENRYCCPIGWKPEKFTKISTLDSFKRAVENIKTYHHHDGEVCGRYCWFNLQAYTKHTSFEIRLHGGTLDATEIKNWVAIQTKFVKWVVDHTMEEINSIFSDNANYTQAQFSALMCIVDDAELSTYYAEKTGLEFISDQQLQFSEVQ